MLLKYLYDDALAQASYLVASNETKEAIVIDPARDITSYLDAARREGVTIAHVTETHIHADFVSGARELVEATGARLYLSAMGGDEWQYEYRTEQTTLLGDGDSITMGEVRLDAIHTPGHTPEHLIFSLTDTSRGDQPLGVFTGDCLFVGDMGRPDLLELAAKQNNTMEQGARQQFANMRRLKAMPGYLQVFPGHGAGSACGKALGSMPSSTIGYEALFNPAFQFDDVDAFVAWLLADQPPMPRYFAQMKRVNKRGPALLRDVVPCQNMTLDAARDALHDGALVIDARAADQFRAAHLPGSISIPPTDKFSTYAGDFVDYDQPLYLIAEPTELDRLIHDLRGIGVDNVCGCLSPDAIDEPTDSMGAVTPDELAAQLDDVYLLDVRAPSEWHEGHLSGAHLLPLPELVERWHDVPRDRRIIVQCSSGVRSQVAASYLRRQGIHEVGNLLGGIDAWKAAGLPLEQ